MCGRFLLKSGLENLAARYNADYSEDLYKSGEIFPSENALAVVKSDGRIRLLPMKWGFPMSGNKRLIINARIETADKKPMFKFALMKRRCLIPANAFFEWKAGQGNKVKHLIGKNEEEIFSMAAIYDEGTFVILTMDSSEKMKSIHERMPLILTREEENIWLDDKADLSMLKSVMGASRFVDLNIEPLAGKEEYTLFDFIE
ncbi:SOS response-associated peptidase [Lutispora saccharofermentans]|uniref:Abasic site processing protein n=1 Tax=Lutispora saccharofermentans TaxID=3024236 RepID=A0ABT1NJD2_9FIRM|nr:SOS response-associated peptidase [Lutispora saccharofermentans]MCQ1531377.1 SOS response-associated peptidase [Lutispora saccharofermentans]